MNTSARKPSALQCVVSDPVSRRRFLALTGGTTAGGTLLAACGNDDDEGDATAATTEDDMASQFGEGDFGIVNYALTLEYLEAAFYADVAKSGLFKGDDLALIERIGQAEQEHDALTATARQLGGQPAAEPKAEFPLDDAKSVLELATVENLGAAAYLGQAAAISDPEILAAALSIHSVEGRHAAVLNTLVGMPPTPDGAFAQGADMQTVLDEVQPFIT